MSNIVIKKPWGYEYVIYQNPQVAVKLLNIKEGEQTSLHCHPNKSTGLVLVSGVIEINFISDSKILAYPAKQTIRRGLFHRTKALTDAILLEVETPVDDDDLIRLTDTYGRERMGYENETISVENVISVQEPDNSYLRQPKVYRIGKCKATVDYFGESALEMECLDDDILIFLQGGLVKVINNKRQYAIRAGDVGLAKVVKRVARDMDWFEDKTVVMRIRKNDNESM